MSSVARYIRKTAIVLMWIMLPLVVAVIYVAGRATGYAVSRTTLLVINGIFGVLVTRRFCDRGTGIERKAGK